MLYRIVGLFVVLVVISGCALPSYEAISEEKEQFIGTWNSTDSQILIINADGSGNYYGFGRKISGGAITITKSELTIELFNETFSKTFKITKPPYNEGGETKMKLNHSIFTKQ